MSDESPPSSAGPSRLADVAAAFLKLGLISFGGPIAHLGYFHTEFVQRRRWLADAEYADLVALCQFLPGPASSQAAFAIGMRRAGLAGALAASVCFLLPSAIFMIAFAYGVSALGDLKSAGWVHGLKLAAVAVVAQAVLMMWQKLCPDRARMTIAFVAAAVVVAASGPWVQVGVIAAGALIGWAALRNVVAPPIPPEAPPRSRGHAWAAGALVVFGVLLVLPGVISHATASHDAAVFDGFYRSGSLVFGGGHVVLPLLREEVVPRGWATDDEFLAGYGAAQAVPGPLFSFAGFLGAIIYRDSLAWLGGAWCLLAIFLPAWLLIGGALPFWDRLRGKSWAQAGLKGASAAVVGVLLAALYTPLCTHGIRGPRDVAVALIAFALLQVWKATPIAVVALCAAAGQWIL